jgi:hypothetical protein
MSETKLPYDPSTLFDNPLVEHTQSSYGCFDMCIQRYVFRYLMLLRLRSINIPFLVGAAVHKGLEILLNPLHKGTEAPERLRTALEAVDAMFEKKRASDILLINRDEQLNKAQAQAHACIISWWFHFEDNMPFVVLETEEVFHAKENATVNSRLINRMAGRLDGRVHMPDEPDVVGLLETKTKYSVPQEFDWISNLPLDRQALWYSYYVRHRKNEPIDRFFYNVIGKPQHYTPRDNWEALKKKMLEAMMGDPNKYFTMPIVLLDTDILHRAYVNWCRLIYRIDNLESSDVTMSTNACGEWGGCPYKSLCQHCADAACPDAVLEMPEIEMYHIVQPHEELREEE